MIVYPWTTTPLFKRLEDAEAYANRLTKKNGVYFTTKPGILFGQRRWSVTNIHDPRVIYYIEGNKDE